MRCDMYSYGVQRHSLAWGLGQQGVPPCTTAHTVALELLLNCPEMYTHSLVMVSHLWDLFICYLPGSSLPPQAQLPATDNKVDPSLDWSNVTFIYQAVSLFGVGGHSILDRAHLGPHACGLAAYACLPVSASAFVTTCSKPSTAQTFLCGCGRRTAPDRVYGCCSQGARTWPLTLLTLAYLRQNLVWQGQAGGWVKVDLLSCALLSSAPAAHASRMLLPGLRASNT
jgi:hypothetical protein